jgi:hypothetical protein
LCILLRFIDNLSLRFIAALRPLTVNVCQNKQRNPPPKKPRERGGSSEAQIKLSYKKKAVKASEAMKPWEPEGRQQQLYGTDAAKCFLPVNIRCPNKESSWPINGAAASLGNRALLLSSDENHRSKRAEK